MENLGVLAPSPRYARKKLWTQSLQRAVGLSGFARRVARFMGRVTYLF
jgi:hypothetical protein